MISFQLRVPVLGESGSYLPRRLQMQVSWHENGGATAVTNQEVQTGAPEAKQLKKTPERESVKALYNLWYGLLLCGIGEKLGDMGLLR